MLATLVALFTVLCSLGVHGYSISIWHDVIDGSPQKEILFGQAREIRSDDTLCALPLAFSQQKTTPPFAVLNDLVGEKAQNMMLMFYPVPIKHLLSFFRPKTWGYFISPDFGMSWNWWFDVFGMIYVFFLLFMNISGNRFGISLLGALAIYYSSYIQFWSLISAPAAIYFAAMLLALHGLIAAKTRAKLLLSSAGLFYFSSAFLLEVYPPTQITFAYLALFSVLGWIFRQNQIGNISESRRWLALGAATAALSLVAFYFYRETAEVFRIMLNTYYPGRRLEMGGNEPFYNLLTDNFLPQLYTQEGGWGPLGNICEASSFFILFPVIAFASVWDLIKRRRVDRLVAALLIYCAFELIWMSVGIPTFLAKTTLFDHVVTYRLTFSFGIANAIILIAFLTRKSEHNYTSLEITSVLSAWALLLVACAFSWKHAGGRVPYLAIFLCTLLSCALGYAVLRKMAVTVMAAMVIIGLVTTFNFNPLVRGGAEFLFENPLSKEMIALDQATGHRSRWLVYDSVQMANLPRILGIKALNGLQFLPQLEFWRKLDPGNQFETSYNRYSLAEFLLPEKPEQFNISAYRADRILAQIHPDNPLLLHENVDYILYNGDRRKMDSSKNYRWIFSYASYHIYERKKL